MCGIAAYLGSEQAYPLLTAALSKLEYRGYDSAGIALIDGNGDIHLNKTINKVASLSENNSEASLKSTVGIAHTRWATHGSPTVSNAHPHVDRDKNIAVVHNGIIENFAELKAQLQKQGYEFVSETDSEVIPHLIAQQMKEGLDFESAFASLNTLLQGSQAIVAVLASEEPMICALRTGYAGGLAVFPDHNGGTITSDLSAILPFLKGTDLQAGVVFLEPHEIVTISTKGISYTSEDGNVIKKDLVKMSLSDNVVEKKGYDHYMLKEIMEQADSVLAATRELIDFSTLQFKGDNLNVLSGGGFDRVLMIGCGTSLNACSVAQTYFEELSNLPTEIYSSSEFRYKKKFVNDKTLVVAVGQSGETADTLSAMSEIKALGARLVTVCNTPGSQADQLAEESYFMNCGVEVGVASTKTFISSLSILYALAAYLGSKVGYLSEIEVKDKIADILSLPDVIAETLKEADSFKEIAHDINFSNNFLFLGRGINYPIAVEGALKLKEISYIHAEGYAAGEMKHGPIALIDESLVTVAIATQDMLYDKMVSNIKEVKARNGLVVALVNESDNSLDLDADYLIKVPEVSSYLAPIINVIPLQFLSYYIALNRGCDIDQPRNLAKSVTVE